MNENYKDYDKAQRMVELEVSRFKESEIATKAQTILAISHLKENLNWYKIKYDDCNSSMRNRRITSEIVDRFEGANEKVISKFLSRKMILTQGQFAKIIFIVPLIVIPVIIYMIFQSLAHTFGIGSLIYSAWSLFGVYLDNVYDDDSTIRLYRISKDKL